MNAKEMVNRGGLKIEIMKKPAIKLDLTVSPNTTTVVLCKERLEEGDEEMTTANLSQI